MSEAPRCPAHMTTPAGGPCPACAEARDIRAEHERREAEQRAEAAHARAVERADLERREIARCKRCDDDGRLAGGRVCHHRETQDEINARGLARCRELMPPSMRARVAKSGAGTTEMEA